MKKLYHIVLAIILLGGSYPNKAVSAPHTFHEGHLAAAAIVGVATGMTIQYIVNRFIKLPKNSIIQINAIKPYFAIIHIYENNKLIYEATGDSKTLENDPLIKAFFAVATDSNDNAYTLYNEKPYFDRVVFEGKTAEELLIKGATIAGLNTPELLKKYAQERLYPVTIWQCGKKFRITLPDITCDGSEQAIHEGSLKHFSTCSFCKELPLEIRETVYKKSDSNEISITTGFSMNKDALAELIQLCKRA